MTYLDQHGCSASENLPKMKILNEPGNYFERVLKALFELGCRWISGGTDIKHTDAVALFVDSEGRITYMDSDDIRPQEFFMEDDRPAYRLSSNGNLVPAEEDDDGWIPHSGGECPVDTLADVQYILRSEGDNRDGPKMKPEPACKVRWFHNGSGSDITHYRIPSMIFATTQSVGSSSSREQETDMSETLTAADALREVATGIEAGDENPYKRVQTLRVGDFDWSELADGDEFDYCLGEGAKFRRKPRTRRIEGEISEKAVETLHYWRGLDGGTERARSLDVALDEILNAVEEG